MRIHLLRAPLLGASLLVALAAPAAATTYVVSPDGGGDFPTIQAAIGACVDGDIVELTDGEFTGEGNRDLDFLGKAITLRSQSGDANLCTIDCEGTQDDPHRGIRLVSGEGADSRVAALTIAAGFDPDLGGGILCLESSPTIVDCVILDCRVAFQLDAGGIYCHLASPLIERCEFRGCYGGVYCSLSPATVRECHFEGNDACDCGALTSVSSAMTITGCTFVGNLG